MAQENDPYSATYDVIIIGSGLAGLTALVKTIQLSTPNYGKILLLEKENTLGGNSAKATSGINLINTPIQKQLEIADGEQQFLEDTSKSSKGQASNPSLQLTLTRAKTHREAREFLEKMGLQYLDVIKCGGHSIPRTHRLSFGQKEQNKIRNTGWELISALQSWIENRLVPGKYDIIKNFRVTSIKLNNSRYPHNHQVIGVNHNTGHAYQYTAKRGIILTTGGFSANSDLIKQHCPNKPRVANVLNYTTNGSFAQGQGLRIGQKLGAKSVDLEHIQLHPTGFVDPKDPEAQHKFLAPEAFRGLGGLMIDPATGQRFVDELTTRDQVTESMLNLGESGQKAYLVMNQQIVDKFGSHLIGFYMFKGLIQTADDINNLAEKLNLSPRTLEQSLKQLLPSTKLYYATVTPVVHYTMGGLAINTKTQVLDNNNYPIPGLYAAGEVTGGLHGANRLAGNSLLECLVFGLTAAEECM